MPHACKQKKGINTTTPPDYSERKRRSEMAMGKDGSQAGRTDLAGVLGSVKKCFRKYPNPSGTVGKKNKGVGTSARHYKNQHRGFQLTLTGDGL